MNKIILILVSCLCMILTTIPVFAESEPVTVVIVPSKDIKDPEKPVKGQRSPGYPILCTIDFDNHRITTSIQDAIVSYELWDEEGESLFASYPDAYGLVAYMSGITGVFQLRLITSNLTYVGYIEL